MRITLINQTFYPDVVSSGQHLADLAVRLAERGNQVTVITSRRAYDDPKKTFPKQEKWRDIRIIRIFATGLGKSAKWRRAADFATFLWSCCWSLLLLPKQDLIVALTSPPLVSFVGAWFAWLRGSNFCYWVMDLNPDEALAAGWLAPNSLAARWLERCSRFSLGHAAKIVVLDRFMRQRILDKGIDESRIAVIPPWSHDSEVGFTEEGRNHFRKVHGLEGKFVVMYSGNHSPCHPLNTVLNAAKQLARNQEVTFLFVGGGSQFTKVKEFGRDHSLSNVLCLPYQPMDQLASALSAADLHLVVMGDPFVGLVHPCKVYNILRIGSPLLYIGPEPSHVSEILRELGGGPDASRAKHGEVDQVIKVIMELKHTIFGTNRELHTKIANRFSKETLLPQLVTTLESTGRS